LNKLRVSGLVKESVVDGPGVRLVIFAQGCPRHCRGCHNPDLIPPVGGQEMTPEEVIGMIKDHITPLIDGITFSGGDPLMQAEALDAVLRLVRREFPRLSVWIYTGYLYEDVKDLPALKHAHVLVDGPYQEDKRDLSLPFRGSANQRIIVLNGASR